TVSGAVAAKLLGNAFPLNDDEGREVALAAYKVVAACGAMALDASPQRIFSLSEYNALWSVGNLEHYLTHSASTLSPAPMELAAALLKELVETMDEAAKGENRYSVMLRFGHAETLMPLFALMRLPGCYYMTNYFDTVGMHWRDFYVVPMASNLQLLLLRSSSGHLYVRADLNEVPVPLIPGRNFLYTPWETAREYLTRCLPMHMQI
ncbi:MAG: hypothetical protein K2K92_10185, partial [Duncaniella sp.]|nr:hypothetical protein [Duncaniella sp.]